MVSFFKDDQILSQALRRGSGQSDPRRFLGNAALSQALNPGPIRHPTQGFAQLANAALANKLFGEASAADEARREGIQSTLSDALAAGRGTPDAAPRQLGLQDALSVELQGGSGMELSPGGGFQVPQPGTPGGIDALIETLGTNPDTAGVGLELQLQQLLREPGTADPFTLGEGQTRFGPEGEVIAKGAKKSTDQFEDVFSKEGVRIGQRNKRTNRFHSIDQEGGKRDLTNAQIANNAEIQAARARILREQENLLPGETLRERLIQLTEKSLFSGRENAEFNPLIDRDLRIASDRKVGEDAGFDSFFNTLEAAAPTPLQPTPVEPAPADQEFGFLDRLFPRNEAVGTTPAGPRGIDRAPTPTRGPRGRQGLGPSRAASPSIESMSLEDLDDLVNAQGANLSATDLQRLEARLNALNRTPQRRLPR